MLRQFIPIDKHSNDLWYKIPGVVKILSDDNNLGTINSQLSLFMAINSLTRVFPVITKIVIDIPNNSSLVKIPLFDGKTIKESISFFLESTSPECEVIFNELDEYDVDVTLIFGSCNDKNRPSVNIGSDGWISFISTNDSPIYFSSNTNPIGAFTSAIIGSMEIFKHLFLKKANIVEPSWSDYDIRHRLKLIEEPIAFSSFTYETTNADRLNPSLPAEIDIGDVFCIGIGAGGGAALYSLASFQRNLRGKIILVDPDELKQNNRNRYIYSKKADADVERKKTAIASELLHRFTQLDVETYPTSYQRFSKENTENMDIVISTVDTKESKQAIQWDIPRIILDAAVIQTEFYLRRVDLGKSMCLVCLERQTTDKTSEQLASKIIGLTTDEIIRLRSENAIIKQRHVNQMKKMAAIHNFTLPKPGERFGDWWLDHCGDIALTQTQERIPLPFATILPGIFIAGEVIKERHYSEYCLDNHYFYNMISSPSDGQVQFKPKADCALCSKDISLKIFKKRFERTSK